MAFPTIPPIPNALIIRIRQACKHHKDQDLCHESGYRQAAASPQVFFFFFLSVFEAAIVRLLPVDIKYNSRQNKDSGCKRIKCKITQSDLIRKLKHKTDHQIACDPGHDHSKNISKSLANSHMNRSELSHLHKKSSHHSRNAHQQRIFHCKLPSEAAEKSCAHGKSKPGKSRKHRKALADTHPHSISEAGFFCSLAAIDITVVHNKEDHTCKKDSDPGKHV